MNCVFVMEASGVPQRIRAISMAQDSTSFNGTWRCVQPHVALEALRSASRVPHERVIGAVNRVLSQMVVAQPNG